MENDRSALIPVLRVYEINHDSTAALIGSPKFFVERLHRSFRAVRIRRYYPPWRTVGTTRSLRHVRPNHRALCHLIFTAVINSVLYGVFFSFHSVSSCTRREPDYDFSPVAFQLRLSRVRLSSRSFRATRAFGVAGRAARLPHSRGGSLVECVSRAAGEMNFI